jgi:hypothetical protein
VQTENEKAVRDLFEQWWNDECADKPFVDYGYQTLTQDIAYHAFKAALQSQVSNTDGWVVREAIYRNHLHALVDLIEMTTCTHENTHRGGAIWEICDDCGAKWADDMGGKPAVFVWPRCVEDARKLLSAAPKAPQQVSNTPQDGPDFSDGHDWEGFPGGCERFGCTSNCSPPQQQEQSDTAEEDAYLIDRLSHLLAEIAIAIRGPEPALTKWGYADLPDLVRELVAKHEALPLNGIKATMFHDEGAVAQCGYCKRYTLDRRALGDRPLTCDCGKAHGWRAGQFRRLCFWIR